MNWLLKLGMFAGAAAAIAGELGKLPLPPKAQAAVGSVAVIAGVIAGLYHPTPEPTVTK